MLYMSPDILLRPQARLPVFMTERLTVQNVLVLGTRNDLVYCRESGVNVRSRNRLDSTNTYNVILPPTATSVVRPQQEQIQDLKRLKKQEQSALAAFSTLKMTMWNFLYWKWTVWSKHRRLISTCWTRNCQGRDVDRRKEQLLRGRSHLLKCDTISVS